MSSSVHSFRSWVDIDGAHGNAPARDRMAVLQGRCGLAAGFRDAFATPCPFVEDRLCPGLRLPGRAVWQRSGGEPRPARIQHRGLRRTKRWLCTGDGSLPTSHCRGASSWRRHNLRSSGPIHLRPHCEEVQSISGDERLSFHREGRVTEDHPAWECRGQRQGSGRVRPQCGSRCRMAASQPDPARCWRIRLHLYCRFFA